MLNNDSTTTKVAVHTTLILMVVWSVLPFLWTFQTSLKFTRDAVTKIPVLWGYEISANAYKAFWFDDDDTNMWMVLAYLVGTGIIAGLIAFAGKKVAAQNKKAWPIYVGVVVFLALAMWVFPKVFEVSDEYQYFVNSVIVTAMTMVISLSVGMLAGYGLARYSGLSGVVILIAALGFRALPRTAFVLPYFFTASRFDLLNNNLILVIALVAVNQPFTIWMFRTFFMEVPKELEESAKIDGANTLTAFLRVIVPIMWPAIVATGLFTLLLAYNEFLFARVLEPNNYTLPVAIVSLTGGESSRTITEGAAASVSITLPIVIVIILFQKHLVKGLAAGAVKG